MQSNSSICGNCNKPSTSIQAGRCLECRAKMWTPTPVQTNTFAQQHHKGGSKNNKSVGGPGPQQGRTDPNAVCRHFLEGNCKYGNGCKYSHAPVVIKNTRGGGHNSNSNSYQNSHQGPKPQQNKYNPQPSPFVHKAPDYAYSSPPLSGPSRQICSFYKQGTCTFGNKCRNLHQWSRRIPYFLEYILDKIIIY